MAIFMISQKEAPAEPKTAEVNNETKPDDTQKTDEPGEVISDHGFLPQKEIDEKTIVLDGPLSQIYTQALNQMFAKESYITEMQSLMELTQGTNTEDDEDKPQPNYVYVVDSPFLEEDGLNEAFSAVRLATENWKNVFVCVEHELISDRTALFLELSRNLGAKVLRTRDATMEMLGTTMKAGK